MPAPHERAVGRRSNPKIGAALPNMGKTTRKSRVEATRGSRRGAAASRGKGRGSASADAKRRLGLRGAAPWAARHAAKHAAEARARNAEPPRPGSARATLRVPSGAEKIKERIGELHAALGRIRALRKNLANGFFQLGNVLRMIQDKKLHEAKGFSSFEAFVEREIDLGKTTALKLLRVPSTFTEEAALTHGMEAVFRALDALDEAPPGSTPPAASRPTGPATGLRQPLPLKPPKPPKPGRPA
jgi:hypothetical protein